MIFSRLEPLDNRRIKNPFESLTKMARENCDVLANKEVKWVVPPRHNTAQHNIQRPVSWHDMVNGQPVDVSRAGPRSQACWHHRGTTRLGIFKIFSVNIKSSFFFIYLNLGRV